MIRNVIFDIGNVLVEWDPEGVFRHFGCSEETIQKIRTALFATGAWTEEDLSIKSPEELLAGFQERCPEGAGAIGYLWEHFGESLRQYPGTKEWIRELQDKGLGVYILSNFGKHSFEQVREDKMDFMDLVDGVLISYEVHQIKPDPAIYQSLLDRYGLKAEECVFLDDREENIRAAQKLGFSGILYRNREQARQELDEMLNFYS